MTTERPQETDEEHVLITSKRTGSSSGYGDPVYHTDENCRHITESCYWWPISGAEDWGLRECSWCSGEYEIKGSDNDHTSHLELVGERAANDDTTDMSVVEMYEHYTTDAERV